MVHHVFFGSGVIMKNKTVLIVFALVVICSPFIKLAADSNKQVKVKISEITLGGLDEHLVATGALAYKNEINLDSQIVSTVTKVHVEEGDSVKSGTVLLELDSFELDNQLNILLKELQSFDVEYAIAVNQAVAAKRKFNINSSLVEKQLLGKEQLDLATEALTRAQLKVDHVEALKSAKQAAVDKVKGLRRYLQVKAPSDGLVTQVNASIGENVYPNQMNVDFNYLISLVDNTAVFVDVKIDERSLANISIGQQADVFLAPYPDKAITGEISFIYPTVNVSAQGIKSKIRIKLHQKDLQGLKLRQNMSCLVKILLSSTKEGNLVPMQAIVERNSETFVYTFDGEKVHRNKVLTGNSDFQRQHIIQGLNTGDKVVVGPMNVLVNLTDGQYVRAIL